MKERFLSGQDKTDPGVPFVAMLVVLGLALLLPLVNLGQPRLGSPHETRVVVTGQGMTQTGDWVVPRFNGGVRLQKPPLPYWTIAAMTRLFGPLDEGLFRLPSALMGMVAVLVTLCIAHTLFGMEVALLAALIQALCVKYVIEARLARVDIYLTFWVAVALCLLSMIFFGGKRRDWLWLLFWASMGLGFLSKWVNIFLFILPALIYGLALQTARRPRWIWQLGGIALFCIIVASWGGLLIRQLGWEAAMAAWNEEVRENITSPIHRANHGVLYYLPQLFLLTFPWCALTPLVFMIPFFSRLRASRPKLIWLFLVVVIPLVALSFVSKKKVDYLLPALPAMAILMACALRVIIQEISPDTDVALRNRRSPAAFIQPAILVVAGLGMLSYFLIDRDGERLAAVTLCGLGLTVTGVVALVQVVRGKGWRAVVSLCCGLTLFGHILFGYFIPRLTQTSPEDFALRAKSIIGESPMGYYRGRDDAFVYYLDRPVKTLNSLAELEAFAAGSPRGFVLVVYQFLEEARQVAGDIALHHPRFRDLSIPLPGKHDMATDLYLLSCAEYNAPTEEMAIEPFANKQWVDRKSFWVAFGFLAQGMFFGRFLLQWIASESRQESIIPVGFWWLSLIGGVMLWIYVFHLRDVVLIVGQTTGLFIYIRNLYFVYAKPKRKTVPDGSPATTASSSTPGPAPTTEE